jgi:hypothetical protein
MVRDKIPFNIKFRSEIESGKMLVRTLDGDKVRIICWDADGYCPIVGLIQLEGESVTTAFKYHEDGTVAKPHNGELLNLVLIRKFDEFEEKLKEIVDSFNDGGSITDEGVVFYSRQLKDILSKRHVK